MAIRSGSRIGGRVASQATADADDDAMNGIDVYALWRTRAERVIASFASAAPRHSNPDANAALRLGRCGVTARVEAAFKSSGTACGALDSHRSFNRQTQFSVRRIPGEAVSRLEAWLPDDCNPPPTPKES